MKTLSELKILMDEPKVMQMAVEIGKIIEQAHKNGKIHGNIRPEYIFVDDEGNYQLEGWGTETVTESNEYGVCMQIKDNYRSPQQHKDGLASVKGDLYSFGLILYQWMNGNVLPFYPTGKKIVTYSDRRKALEKRMEGENFSPLKDISAKFSKIIFKLCAYDEMDRYENAKAFLKDLGVSVDSKAEAKVEAEEERKRAEAEAKAKAEEERKKAEAEAKAKAEEERKKAEAEAKAKAEEERKKAEAEAKAKAEEQRKDLVELKEEIELGKEVEELSGVTKQKMMRYIAVGAAGVLILVGGILIGTSMGDKENNNSLVTGIPTNAPLLTPTVTIIETPDSDDNTEQNIQKYDDGEYGTLLIRYDEEANSLYRLRQHADGTVIYEYAPEKVRFPYDIAMEYCDGMLFSTTSLEKYFIEQGKTVWTTYRFWDSGHRRYALNGEDVGTDSMDLDCDIECVYTYGEKNSHKITNAVFVLYDEQGVEECRLEYMGDRLLQFTYWTWYENGRTKSFGDYTYNDDLETPGYEYVHQDYEKDVTLTGNYDENHKLISWSERFTDEDGNDITMSYKGMFHRE